MTDPVVPILKRLLSLDTPVARRIFEIALLLGLIFAASYLKEHSRDQMVIFAATTVSVLGSLLLIFMMFVLITVFVSKARKDVEDK
jgi:hypothetical protein